MVTLIFSMNFKSQNKLNLAAWGVGWGEQGGWPQYLNGLTQQNSHTKYGDWINRALFK